MALAAITVAFPPSPEAPAKLTYSGGQVKPKFCFPRPTMANCIAMEKSLPAGDSKEIRTTWEEVYHRNLSNRSFFALHIGHTSGGSTLAHK